MKTAAPISFAGSQLAETRHACAFFNSDEEEYRVLLPFIKDGFEDGHKAVHVVNTHQRNEHMRRLVVAGIDPAGRTFEPMPKYRRYLRLIVPLSFLWCDAVRPIRSTTSGDE